MAKQTKSEITKKAVRAKDVKAAITLVPPRRKKPIVFGGGKNGGIFVDDLFKRVDEMKKVISKFPKGWNGGERFEKGLLALEKIVNQNAKLLNCDTVKASVRGNVKASAKVAKTSAKVTAKATAKKK